MAKNNDLDLNEEQRAVVEYYDSNLLVSAGAGSGKTRVVISKLMDIIKNKRVSVSELLVTTFTNAAGSQMSSKLAKSLSDEIMNTNDDELRYYLIEQLELLPQASIGTLHTFCEKLIKKYFYEIGIEPSFKILEEKDANFFKNQILDDIFEEYTKNDDKEFFNVVEAFKEDRSLVNFKNKLNDLLSFIKSKNGYVDFLKEATKNLGMNKNQIETLLNDYLFFRVNILLNYYNNFLNVSYRISSEKFSIYLEKIINLLSEINKENNFIENYKIFSKLKLPTMPRISPNFTDGEFNLHKEIKYFNDNSRKKLLDKKDFGNIEEHIDDIKWISNENLQNKLIEILNKFNDRYRELKLDKNFLDFNDLEENALKILDNEELRKTIQNKYKYIFVDEYQDTNEIQETILNKISSNNKNMIMVGDIKQSIYGFRNTSPEIFLEKFNKYKNDNSVGMVKNLNMNYRSQKTILDYCNFLFGKIMTVDTNNIDYKNTQSFKVGNNNGNDTSCVEFHIIDKVKNISDLSDEKDEKLQQYDINTETKEVKDLEPELLINIVNKLLTQNIYDGDNKKYKKCEYKDISILCRSSNEINEVAKRFSEVKIPFTTTYSVNLYREEEIRLILSFLEVIQNDYNNIALVSCLSSFYFNVTSDELMEIRRKYPNEKFYIAIKNYSNDFDDSISKKITKFYEDIEEFREILNISSLKELVEKIYEKYNIIPYYSLRKDKDLKIKNLYTFLSTLNGGFYTQNLTAYLNYINGFAINDKYDITVNGGENSIKIQTIHASKGLEYNVVILYKAEKSYFNENKKGILKDKDLGLAIQDIDVEESTITETLSHIAFKIKTKEQSIKEEMRILYVALTRAKNKLIIIGSANLSKLKIFETSFDIINANSYLKLMMGVLNNNEINSIIFSEDISAPMKKKFNDSEFKFYRYLPDSINIYKPDENNVTINVDIDKNMFNMVRNYTYRDPEAPLTRLKNTVTALMEENDEYQSDFSTDIMENILPQEDDTKQSIDALTRGNSYHNIMCKSNLDINNLEKLKEMYDFKYVDENEIITCIKTMSKLAENRKIYAEKMFLMNIKKSLVYPQAKTDEKILIQGIVDVLLEGEKDLILVDYKTTKGGAKYLTEKYKTQIDLYTIALEKHYKKPVKKRYIYSFFRNKLIEI